MTTESAPRGRGFRDRESPLLDIVRAFNSGEVDWPTTQSALMKFRYAPSAPKAPPVTDPGYGEWYNDAAVGDDPAPGTWEELDMAHHIGMIPRDRWQEFLRATSGPPPKTKA